MRYQALILLLIVLVSSYLLRETSVFSQEGNSIGSSQATVIDTLDLNASPKAIQKNEQEIKTAQVAGTESQPAVSTSALELLVLTPSAPVQVKTENAIAEKPIIEDADTSINSLCDPIEAEIFIAQTIDGASILYEKNSQNHWPIASITKLMSAVVALENINQSSVIEITPAIEDKANGNSTLKSGESYTANDLIKAMLSVSSNDAALALAANLDKDAFVQKMNDKAKEISMSQTDFDDPSGLSYLNQSTAHDLFLLLSYIKKQYPYILDVTRQSTVTIRNKTTGVGKTLTNINEFAGRSDFLGGKTGFIDPKLGGNLISLFYKNGKMVYIGVLGSPDRFGETEKILSCLQ